MLIVRWDLGKSDQSQSGRKERGTRATPRGLGSHAPHRSAFTTVRSHNRQRLRDGSTPRVVVKNRFFGLVFRAWWVVPSCDLAWSGCSGVFSRFGCGCCSRSCSIGQVWSSASGRSDCLGSRAGLVRAPWWSFSALGQLAWLNSFGGSLRGERLVVNENLRLPVVNGLSGRIRPLAGRFLGVVASFRLFSVSRAIRRAFQAVNADYVSRTGFGGR